MSKKKPVNGGVRLKNIAIGEKGKIFSINVTVTDCDCDYSDFTLLYFTMFI